MCGRFSLHHPTDEIHEHFNIEYPVFLVEPRYNIAPTQTVAVVALRPRPAVAGEDPSDAHPPGAGSPAPRSGRALGSMRWGLVPKWSKEGKPFINARGESIAEKPSFRTAFRQRRVIVPCSGFYEWATDGKAKIPRHIQLGAGALFGMAAIWETGPDGKAGVSLITVPANAEISAFHDRMPVILDPEEYAVWLDPTNPTPEALIRSLPAGRLTIFPVSSRVNGVKDDDARLIEPERRGLFG